MAYSVTGKSGQLYYYRTERRDGKVVRIYLGCGEIGCAVRQGFDESNELFRTLEYDAQLDRLIVIARERAREKLLREYFNENSRRIAVLLRWAGYHRPKRGAWRRKQGVKMSSSLDALSIIASAWGTPSKQNDKAKEAQERAKVFKNVALPVVGSMYDQVCTLIKAACNNDPAVTERNIADFQRQWQDITGSPYTALKDSPIGPLDYLLTERMILSRMELCRAEVRLERAKRTPSETRLIASCEDSMDSVHRRFLISVKMVAEVHRLAGPQFNFALPGSVQVNVGEKQINATGVSSLSES